MHRRSLPIAQPCHERFEAMAPDGTRRFCERCQESVHDLSAMTRRQAEHFLLQHQGQPVCVRYRAGSDGTLRFRPPPPRTVGPLLVALAGLMAACTGHLEPGELEVPDEPMCEDASGFPIPCSELDDGMMTMPDADPDDAIDADLEDDGVVEIEVPGLDDDGYVMGGITVPEYEGVPGEPPEVDGCPIQIWDDASHDDDEYDGRDAMDEPVLMGRVEPYPVGRARARRIERQYRREQRRARRQG